MNREKGHETGGVQEFVVRRYQKRELARLYRPNTPKDRTAVELLRRDIQRCKGLTEALQQTGCYNVNGNDFTKAQVAVIVDYLGEP